MALDLDLLTVNLWGLPWPVARERRERKRRFFQLFSARSFDLVGIQELWWPWRRLRGRVPLRVPCSARDSGLALAGSLRVRGEVEVEHFRDHGGCDRLKRKGVLRAGVETQAGAELAVQVTHLQAGRRHAGVRARQLDQLLHGAERERRPIVLLGDFNLHAGVDEDERCAERLQAEGFVDAALALSRDEPTFLPCNPYVRRRARAERFDRVYLRDGQGLRFEPLEVQVLRTRPHPISDHHPVRARVRLCD